MVQLTNNWHQPEQWSLLNALTNAIELRQAELCDKSVSIGLDVDPQASGAPCPVALGEAIDCIMGLAVARSPAGGDIHISLCQTGQAFEIEIADCGDDSLLPSGPAFSPQDCGHSLGLSTGRQGVEVFATACPQGGMAWTIVAQQRLAHVRAA